MSNPDNMDDLHSGTALHRDITRQMAAYLEGRGVPERKQASFVSEVTGLSMAQARRRLGEGPGWLIEEIILIVQHFEDSISTFFGATPLAKTPSANTACEMRIGDTWYGARAVIRKLVERPKVGQLVALRGAPRWKIIPYTAGAHSPSEEFFEVADLTVLPKPSENVYVAVLDDDVSVASAVRDALNAGGFTAKAFSSEAELAPELDDFDVYIIDFLLGPGKETASALVKGIRAKKPSAPILLLTGQARETLRAEIANLVSTFDVEIHEKPAQLMILESVIHRWQSKRSSHPQ
ncbi:helix-turn-helix domain-containing protein [Aquabacterium sp. CECT 9606]|uniref:helix-turn-helix domain-containing protein n=1 Tax=Aquabacterium sp. CECT 9606 TaxID=2845822 RepID=UPI001E3C1E8A|nr:helix-turn-helix domain-containing protein [Aquabacterium sp. CECT 9606]